MPGDNKQYLIPLSERSPEEKKRIQHMGGVASQKKLKKAKSMREAAQFLLKASLQSEDEKTREALETLGLSADQQSAILLAAIGKAKDGDIEASRFVRDTSGESPTQSIAVSAGDIGSSEDLKGLSEEQLKELLKREDPD